jgi:hypothetical protein
MKKLLPLLAAGAALAALPALAPIAAQAAAAHPDFSGAWQVAPYSPALTPSDGKPVPFKPAAKAVYDKHVAAAAKGDRSWDETRICIPEGLPRLLTINEPFEIMQKDKVVYFVAQNRLPFRAYFGEQLPTDVDPLYLGFSVAKWDGPALVVHSNGFRDNTVLDDKGIPHSEKLDLTQTFKLGPGGKTMTVTYRIEDPDTFTRPWTATKTFAKKPAGFHMPEEVCAEKLETTAPKR